MENVCSVFSGGKQSIMLEVSNVIDKAAEWVVFLQCDKRHRVIKMFFDFELGVW